MSDTLVETLVAEDRPQADTGNAAWVSINTPSDVDTLCRFCHRDVERLFRINPYLEFDRWERLVDNRYVIAGRNFSQEKPFEFRLEMEAEALPDGLRIRYRGGLKRDTVFKVESSPHGSKLTIHENYLAINDEEQHERLGEVDRSLPTWAGDLQKFLIMWKQWSWLGPWRWYMGRIWQRMKPSGRRIAYMFWWITLVEIALIILGAGIYWIEYT